MINSELLAQSILDAKAVRATALANAKHQLEEAFAPRFEAMFADKLKEETTEEEEEESVMQEVEAPNQVSGTGGEAKGPSTKPVTKGQPKTPKGGAGDKDFKPVKAGLGPKDVANPAKSVNEVAEEEEEEEGKVNEAGLTSEDLNEIIAELENEIAAEEKGTPIDIDINAEPGTEDGDENPEPTLGHEEPSVDGGEMHGDGEEEPEVNIDAEPGSDVNVDEPQGMNAGGLEGGEEEVPAVHHHNGEEDDEENINLEELLAALNEEAEEEEEEEEGKEMDEAVENGVPSNVDGQDKSGGVKGYAKTTSNKWGEAGGKNHNISGKGNIGDGNPNGKPMKESAERVALKEAYQTIEYLRGQINEVNLLNAKLLYTNKLFKEFAGVLDDTYRMKIVESFDLTKSVREVKLAYALLAESLNFGIQNTRVQKNTISNKPVVKNSQIKQITEGFASKAVSSTKPSKIITEGVDMMASRFKKLAGIKDEPQTKASGKK